jgi:putative MATE family efflux protein
MDGFISRDKSFYRTFFKLTLTLMLEQIVVLSVNLADNLMLGSYSETALAGVAAVNQIQFILQQLVFGVGNGMIVLASQYWGIGETDPIKKLLSIALRAAGIIVAVFMIFVSVSPEFVVRIFSKDPGIIAEGAAYLRIVRFSYPFFAATTIVLGGLRSMERVKPALIASLFALVINCSINFVLISGRFGFPELGVRGAAIGTLTARVLECAGVCVYVLAVEKKFRFRLRDLKSRDGELTRKYIRVSLPLLTAAFMWGLNTAIQTAILGHLSDSAIAAHSISSTIFLFFKVASVGAASAAAIITGKTVGEGDMKKLEVNTRTLQLLFVAIGLLMGSLLFAVRIPFLSVYNISAETYRLAKTFMLIEATVLLFMSYEMCTNTGIISGGGDTKFVFKMDLVFIWGIVMPASLLSAFVFRWPPEIVLICLNLDQYLKCIAAFIRCNSYKWIRKLNE